MNDKKYNYVYITTNLINGKQYVGDHSTDILRDGYLGSGRPLFKRAKAKYGNTNFEKKILEHFSTKQEAFNAQEKWIKKYNTLAPNGYNISPMGGHRNIGSVSEATKKKMSLASKGKAKSPEHAKKCGMANLGKKQSEETKKKRRDSMLGKNRGPKSDETKQKISNSKKGKKLSEDHKKKLAEATKKYWQLKKISK